MYNGMELGNRIMESHGGKTGTALAMAILAGMDPTLAGQYVGQCVVDKHGGKTGQALVEEMVRCAAK